MRKLIVCMLLLAGCHGANSGKVAIQRKSSADIEKEIPSAFKNHTGYDVANVKLYDRDTNRYWGLVTLSKDSSVALLDIRINKDTPTYYTWVIKTKSMLMINDIIKHVMDTVNIGQTKKIKL